MRGTFEFDQPYNKTEQTWLTLMRFLLIYRMELPGAP